MNTQITEKETRLHLRTTPGQKQLLARAAQTRHLNMTQFVLQASLEAAEKVIREEEAQNVTAQNAIVVGTAHYDWLMQKLDEPPQDNPELRRLLAEPSRWND